MSNNGGNDDIFGFGTQVDPQAQKQNYSVMDEIGAQGGSEAQHDRADSEAVTGNGATPNGSASGKKGLKNPAVLASIGAGAFFLVIVAVKILVINKVGSPPPDQMVAVPAPQSQQAPQNQEPQLDPVQSNTPLVGVPPEVMGDAAQGPQSSHAPQGAQSGMQPGQSMSAPNGASPNQSPMMPDPNQIPVAQKQTVTAAAPSDASQTPPMGQSMASAPGAPTSGINSQTASENQQAAMSSRNDTGIGRPQMSQPPTEKLGANLAAVNDPTSAHAAPASDQGGSDSSDMLKKQLAEKDAKIKALEQKLAKEHQAYLKLATVSKKLLSKEKEMTDFYASGKSERRGGKAESSAAISKAYSLKAVVEGLAWVNVPDGRVVSVRAGDQLAKDVTVTSIDPVRMVVKTTSGEIK